MTEYSAQYKFNTQEVHNNYEIEENKCCICRLTFLVTSRNTTYNFLQMLYLFRLKKKCQNYTFDYVALTWPDLI